MITVNLFLNRTVLILHFSYNIFFIMLIDSDTLRKALVTLSTFHASCQNLQPTQPHEFPQITNMMDSKTRYKILNSFLHSPKLVELISLSLSPLLSPVVGEGDIAVNINFNILQSLMKFIFLLVQFNFASVFIPIMTPPQSYSS